MSDEKDDDKKDFTDLHSLEDFEHDESDEQLDDLLMSDPFAEKTGIDEILIDDPFSENEDTINDIMIDDPFSDESDGEEQEEKLDEVFGADEEEEDPSLESIETKESESEVVELDNMTQPPPSEEIERSDPIVEKLEFDSDEVDSPEDGKNIQVSLGQDLEKEMEAHLPSHVEMESIPSYSLKISGFSTRYDKDEVRRILREFSIIQESELNLWERAIERGEILIPRIGEFVAITCAHKLRHINAHFELGLSEEIYASEVDSIHKGPINNETIKLNKNFSYEKKQQQVSFEDIVTSTTSQLENFEIHQYLGIVTEEQSIDTAQYDSNVIQLKVNDEQTREFEPFGFKEVYRSLTDKLKHQAYRKKANAVINIQFQHFPIPHRENFYKIIATGTLAWVQEKN